MKVKRMEIKNGKATSFYIIEEVKESLFYNGLEIEFIDYT